MCDTKEHVYKKLIDSYTNPLIWYFNNIIMRYGKNEEPNITFIILYKSNGSYFIDIGYGSYNFGYSYKIKETIELQNNIYETLFEKIIYHFGYVFNDYETIDDELFNENDLCEGYDFIKNNNQVIIYKLDDNIFYINNFEKNNLVDVSINIDI